MGRSPIAVLINDELFEVGLWQEVYLVFLRWLSKNKPIAFAQLLNRTDSKGKYLLVTAKSKVLSLIEEEGIPNGSQIKRKYKRLTDSAFLSNVTSETEEEPLYVFVNASAATFMHRIREAMQQADMTEESMTIELK